MGNTKSLIDQEAIEKIKEFASEKICLFCTYEDEGIESRPMSTQAVDEDGTLWFFSNKTSHKNKQLKLDRRVYLMYMETGKVHYLSLSAMAEIVVDKEKAKELWNPFVKAWFEQGVDDPDLTLIKVTPSEGHYWDTKHGKLVNMIQIATAAVTGKKMEVGVEGDIKP